MAKIELHIVGENPIDDISETIIQNAGFLAQQMLEAYAQHMVESAEKGISPVTGYDFTEYTEAYKEYRRDLGLSTDVVDLNITGGLSNYDTNNLSESAELYFTGNSYDGEPRGEVFFEQDLRGGSYDRPIFPENEEELPEEFFDWAEQIITDLLE